MNLMTSYSGKSFSSYPPQNTDNDRSDYWTFPGRAREHQTHINFQSIINCFKPLTSKPQMTFLMDCCAASRITRSLKAQPNISWLVASGETGATQTGPAGFTPNINDALVIAAASQDYLSLGRLYGNMAARVQSGQLAVTPIYGLQRDDTDITASPRFWPIEQDPRPTPTMKEVLQENIAAHNARPESISLVVEAHLDDCSPQALQKIQNSLTLFPFPEAISASVQVRVVNGNVIHHWEKADSGYVTFWIDACIWCELEDMNTEEFDIRTTGVRGDIRKAAPIFAWTETG